jgi:sugar phosphate isomerase/epimerase
MADRIALQLYSVRDLAGQDYDWTIRQVAEAGYRAVEPAGFPGTTAQKAADLYKELGLTVVAAHSALPLGDQKNEVLETMATIGSPRLISPYANPNDLQTIDGVKKLCDSLNEANEVARANGMSFGFHNHWAEYGKAEGRYVYQLMQEFLDPTVFFELDTYWIQVAGVDPAEVIREMGDRAPLIHVKDGPGNREQSMCAVGEGVMDWPKVLGAAGDRAEWWIVEMDRCDTDVMEAVRKSYNYLKNLHV